jgi:hypothetical protein
VSLYVLWEQAWAMFFGISLLGIFAMRLADDIHVIRTKVINLVFASAQNKTTLL